MALATLAIAPTAGRADVAYSYVTDQSAYNLSAPGTITVDLYLQEKLTGTSTSLIAADGGMSSAAASISRAAGQNGASFVTTGTGTTPAFGSTTVNTAGFAGGGATAVRYGADNNTTNPGAQTASQATFGVLNQLGVGSGPTNINPDSTGRILIGTVQIAATSGTTKFNLSNYPPSGTSSGNTITTGSGIGAGVGFLDLDYSNNLYPGNTQPFSPNYTGTLANSTFFTVTVTTAVPEPSSILLCGLVVCGGAFRVYRGRHGKKGALPSA